MTVAQTILDQLGGNKFIAMTGSKNFISDENSLSMKLAGNKSKANHLRITLTGLDLYDMEFTKYTMPKFNLDKGTFRDEKIESVASWNGLMFDQLQEFFALTTGLNTRL